MPIRFIAAALVVFAIAGQAQAQSLGAASSAAANGGLTYQQARGYMPNLSRVIFEKADRSGDGVIDSREMPMLQALYQSAYLDR